MLVLQNRSNGFTLIELMIVISIIGILATMALPSFQDRVIRTQVTEGIALAEIAKKGVEDYYKVKGKLPENNAQAGLPEMQKIIGNFVKTVQVDHGAVAIQFGNRINRNASGKILTLRPAIVKDAAIVPIAWVCGYATVPDGMIAIGKNTSDLSPRHVPVDCRY